MHCAILTYDNFVERDAEENTMHVGLFFHFSISFPFYMVEVHFQT